MFENFIENLCQSPVGKMRKLLRRHTIHEMQRQEVEYYSSFSKFLYNSADKPGIRANYDLSPEVMRLFDSLFAWLSLSIGAYQQRTVQLFCGTSLC